MASKHRPSGLIRQNPIDLEAGPSHAEESNQSVTIDMDKGTPPMRRSSNPYTWGSQHGGSGSMHASAPDVGSSHPSVAQQSSASNLLNDPAARSLEKEVEDMTLQFEQGNMRAFGSKTDEVFEAFDQMRDMQASLFSRLRAYQRAFDQADYNESPTADDMESAFNTFKRQTAEVDDILNNDISALTKQLKGFADKFAHTKTS